MRLRFDKQLVAQRVVRFDVTAIKRLLCIGLRVARGVPNGTFRQRLAGSIQDAGELATHITPAVRLPV
jgi:hypothetical protein